MADKKISALPVGADVDIDDLFVVVRDGATVQVTRDQVLATAATAVAVAANTAAIAAYRLDPFGWGFPMTGPPINHVTALAAVTASTVYYGRCLGGGTITKIAVEVGATAGNIAVATYANSGVGRAAVPGARTATSGSVATPANGYAEIPLAAAVTVAPGDWFAVASDSAITLRVHTTGTAAGVLAGCSLRQSAAFPPPATAVPAVNTSRAPLLIGIP